MTAPGVPRPFVLLREGVAMARSQPVATVLVALVGAAVCATVLATTGQSAAAEREVLSRIDDAGTRAIVVTDQEGRAQLGPDVVDRLAALSAVDWVVGLGSVLDTRNSAVGDGADLLPVRTLYGDVPPVLALHAGRWPDPGEVVVGAGVLQEFGFAQAVGGLDPRRGTSYGLVGSFTADDPLGFLADGGLVRTVVADDGGAQAVRQLYILVDRPSDVATVAAALPAVLDARDVTSLRIETPEVLTQVRDAVAGELGRFSRQLVAMVLAVGLVLTAVTVYGSVTTRRRDFGRRRALGASRSSVVVLVLVQTAVGAFVGASVGAAAGLTIVARLAGAVPSAAFTGGLVAATILAAAVAAVPPALLAAMRDPVRILRVP